jgi:putative DNA primase/helicase
MNTLSTEQIRAALGSIPSDLPRDEWARVAMALKSELGDTGFDLFDDWSKRGERYNAKATHDTWKSVRAGGAVKIGTLIHLAKSHGFQFNETSRKPPANEADQQAIAQARKARDKRERDEREAAQREAAKEATRLWNTASETGESPYLTRKRVNGYGVRYSSDSWLLVPIRDVEGTLWNVQRIAPQKPADGPDKLYLKGARKSGLFHVIGELKSATVVLVAEGYATAATLHEATRRPVVVAFDAGNLKSVAQAIRKANPSAMLVMCGDDDRETHTNTGRNPGREAAESAAKQVATNRARTVAVFPSSLPEDGSDFNDMAAHAGADAVRECVESAIEQAKVAPNATAESNDTPKKSAGVMDRFTVNAEGVWYTDYDPDGHSKSPVWVCSCLAVPALTRDADGQGWGYLLEFNDPAGNARQWAMPARMLAGDGTEFRSILLGLGLRVASRTQARALLTQYIQSRQPTEHARCTDRVGWHGGSFVLPRETIGESGERIVFQTDGTVENTFRERGTIEQWRERVAKFCVGNSRLVFAVSCAFAGPVIRPAGIDSGGFHLRGDSSCGKTTALRAAASVYGGPNYMQRWRTTDNALEGIAVQHCDGLLILDELAQVDSKTAGECAYMLANETAKARSTRTGQARARLQWRLLFLSAGEIGLAAHMAESGKRAKAGQELRMADIPADAGAGLGIFEELHGHDNGALFAQHLAKVSEAQHGAVGHAFLCWLVAHADTLRKRVRDHMEGLVKQWIPTNASGQVQRVGRRFAVVAVAGELATEAGFTGWPIGEATHAAKTCFQSWIDSRGGIGNAEDRAMLRQVRAVIQKDGDARFTNWDRANDDHAPKVMNRLGFRKPVKDSMGEFAGWDYYFLQEPFRTEVCNGFDSKAVLKVLREHDHLEVAKGRGFDIKQRLPGLGLTNCYCVKSSILESDADD